MNTGGIENTLALAFEAYTLVLLALQLHVWMHLTVWWMHEGLPVAPTACSLFSVAVCSCSQMMKTVLFAQKLAFELRHCMAGLGLSI